MELVPTKTISALSILPHLALRYVNVPYIFGGKSALVGLDCSGLVCELLQAVGVLSTNEELGSQQLYNKFKDSQIGVIGLGSLAFYGKSVTEIDHVAMFLDTHLIIEAGHGTSDTLTVEQAKLRDAKGRVRPFNYRKDLVAVVRPLYEDFGLHD